MLIISIVLAAIGAWEIYVFQHTHDDADLYIIACSFMASGFLAIMKFCGGWV